MVVKKKKSIRYGVVMANFGFSLCPVASFVSLLGFFFFVIFFWKLNFFFFEKRFLTKFIIQWSCFWKATFTGKGTRRVMNGRKLVIAAATPSPVYGSVFEFEMIYRRFLLFIFFFSSFIYLFVIWRRWSLAVAAVGRTFNGVWLTHRFVGWLRRVPSTVSIIGVCDWFNSSLDGRVSH